MPIISVRDNESNRWKRNTKKKDRKEQGGTETTVKGSKLNDFVVNLS